MTNVADLLALVVKKVWYSDLSVIEMVSYSDSARIVVNVAFASKANDQSFRLFSYRQQSAIGYTKIYFKILKLHDYDLPPPNPEIYFFSFIFLFKFKFF